MKKAKTARNTTSLAPVVCVLLFTAGYMAAAYLSLEEASRRVPLLTGYVTLFLLALEALKRLLPAPTGQDPGDAGETTQEAVPLPREAMGLVYIAGLAAGIYYLGFFVSVPVYLFLAVALLGKQPKKTATILAVSASLIFYLVFQVLLETRLYPGLLFS